MTPTPKKPSEVLKEFEKKWYVPSGETSGKRDHEYWYYQALNGDDPHGEMQSWFRSSLISLLLEAKGRTEKMESGLEAPANNQAYDLARMDATAVLDQLIAEVKQI